MSQDQRNEFRVRSKPIFSNNVKFFDGLLYSGQKTS